MPIGNMAAEKSFSTLVREIDENLRLTLRSQEALGTAACSPAKGQFDKTSVTTLSTSDTSRHSSAPQTNENSSGAANSTERQQGGVKKPNSASSGRAWLPYSKESCAGGRKQQVSSMLAVLKRFFPCSQYFCLLPIWRVSCF